MQPRPDVILPDRDRGTLWTGPHHLLDIPQLPWCTGSALSWICRSWFPGFPLLPFENFPAHLFSHPAVQQSPSERLSNSIDLWWDPSFCTSRKFQGTARGEFCSVRIYWMVLERMVAAAVSMWLSVRRRILLMFGPSEWTGTPVQRGQERKNWTHRQGVCGCGQQWTTQAAGRTPPGAVKDSSMDGPVESGIFKRPPDSGTQWFWFSSCSTFLSSGPGPLTFPEMPPPNKTIKKVWKWVHLHKASLPVTTVGHGAAVWTPSTKRCSDQAWGPGNQPF